MQSEIGQKFICLFSNIIRAQPYVNRMSGSIDLDGKV
jgi:hypothetical protein